MIAEDLLERGLAEAAGEYDVPSGAVDRLRDQLAPSVDDGDAPQSSRHSWRPGRRGWLALAAAAVVLLVAVPLAIGGGGESRVQHDVLAGAVPAASPVRDAGGAATGSGASGGGSAPIAAPAHAAPKAVSRTAAGSVAGGAPAAIEAPPGYAADSAGSGKGPVAPVPSVPDRVIKTGELDLQVAKGQVGHTLDLLTGLATTQGGYVASSRTSEGGFAPSGSVTLRVPVAAFENTVAKARHITTGVKVLSLQTSGRDVTSRYVDLVARIKALERTRQTFLTLMTRASTIGETLAVQQQITDVQTQIEQLKGQKNVLANRSALSTLTVTVDQKVVAQATKPHRESGIHKAFSKSVSRFVHGVEAIIGIIGPVLLVAMLIALGWFAARFGYRALRRRMV